MTTQTVNPALGPAFRQAVQLYNDGKLEEAAAACERVMSIDRNFPEGWFLSANVAVQRGDLARAVSLLDVALTLDHRHTGALKARADIALSTNSPTDAERLYRQAADINPRDNVALFGIAVALQAQGKLEEAAGAYRRHLRIDLGAPSSLVNLGVIALELGDQLEATRMFGMALDRDPGNFGALANLAMLGYALNPGESIRIAVDAMNRGPHSLTALLNAAFMLRQVGQEADAEQLYARFPAEYAPGVAGRISHDFALRHGSARVVGTRWQALDIALDTAPANTVTMILNDPHGGVTKAVQRAGRTPILGADDPLQGPIGLVYFIGDVAGDVTRLLERLGTALAPGAVFLVDRFFGYPGWVEEAPRAFDQWCQATGRTIDYLAFNPFGSQAVLKVS